MISFEGRGPRHSIAEREDFLHAIRHSLPPRHILLSTCDRVELYTDDGSAAATSDDAGLHLFSVAAGLDSPLLGENQVLAQVKTAYTNALAAGHTSGALNRLFQAAIRAGKLARTRTAIARGAVSHAQAAIEILRRSGGDFTKARITVIGVNHLNRSVLRFLVRNGASTVFLGNRTYDRACAEAETLRCFAFPLDEWPQVLAQTDILITATSAPHTIIRLQQFPIDRPMTIIDLAVPRDVDPAIRSLPGIILYDIADIEGFVAGEKNSRADAALEAEKIVKAEWERFLADELKRKNCHP